MQLSRQRAEVRLLRAVLQVAGNLGLLRLRTAAPHRVDPLAHLAGVTYTCAAAATLTCRGPRHSRVRSTRSSFSWAQRYLTTGYFRTPPLDSARRCHGWY